MIERAVVVLPAPVSPTSPNASPSLTSKAEAKKRVIELLEIVGVKSDRYDDYPHQFSGGQKQRVVIAMSLLCNPKLLIADEPTTALDVTIQAQVLDIINKLREQYKMSMILITHDLASAFETFSCVNTTSESCAPTVIIGFKAVIGS